MPSSSMSLHEAKLIQICITIWRHRTQWVKKQTRVDWNRRQAINDLVYMRIYALRHLDESEQRDSRTSWYGDPRPLANSSHKVIWDLGGACIIVRQTVELSVMWDSMALKWLYCNDQWLYCNRRVSQMRVANRRGVISDCSMCYMFF